jgi:glutaredoxin
MGATQRRPWLTLVLVVALTATATTLWQRHRGAGDLAAIAALAGPGDLYLYSATWCGWCTRAKRQLDAHAVRYGVCEIDLDAGCQARFDALAARLGRSGTPIVLVRGEPQLGFDAGRVRARLEPGAAQR